MRSSRLPVVKTLADFDFSFQPSIKREQIDALHELGFFQLVNRRYEHASTVLTSNQGFERWGEILHDEVMAAALLDRLLHRCHIVNISSMAIDKRIVLDPERGRYHPDACRSS